MPVRVLIVDDDASFRDAARLVLTGQGYAVVGEAASVAEARRAIDGLDPDAVLLDVNLPDGDGLTLAEALHRGPGRRRVLLTSGDAGAASPRMVARCGAAGFVPKTRLAGTDLGRYLKP